MTRILTQKQRSAISLEAAEEFWVRSRYSVVVGIQHRHQSAKESVRTAKVSLVTAGDVHAAHTTAKFERVLSLLPRSEVLQLPALVDIDTVANLRTATNKRPANVYAHRRQVATRL